MGGRLVMVRSGLIALTIFLTGCGTIMIGGEQNISISSTPSAARITVKDTNGYVVAKGITPTTITLSKGSGKVFDFTKPEYTLVVEKEGYAPVDVQLAGKMNLWYLLGNGCFLNVFGWFVIDPYTGGMWTIKPEDVNADFTASSMMPQDGELFIVLREDVPKELEPLLVPLN